MYPYILIIINFIVYFYRVKMQSKKVIAPELAYLHLLSLGR